MQPTTMTANRSTVPMPPVAAEPLTNVQEHTLKALVELEGKIEDVRNRLLGPTAIAEEGQPLRGGNLGMAMDIRSRVYRLHETLGAILAEL